MGPSTEAPRGGLPCGARSSSRGAVSSVYLSVTLDSRASRNTSRLRRRSYLLSFTLLPPPRAAAAARRARGLVCGLAPGLAVGLPLGLPPPG